MLIRDYREDDYSDLVSLWNELGLHSEERGDSPLVIQNTIKQGARLLVMENPDDKMIIGSSWMTCDGRRIFLHHFGIKTEFQNKGHGIELAKASLEHIKKQGYQVKLEVHKDNIPAKNLYKKMGFFAFTDYDIYMIRSFPEE